MSITHLNVEPYLDKHQLAELLSSSYRWVEDRSRQGMPSEKIAGKLKFKLSRVEPWLREHGYWEG